jgi:PAS domain-containing protein
MVDYGHRSPLPFSGCGGNGALTGRRELLSLGRTGDGALLDLGQPATESEPTMPSVFCEWLGFCPTGWPFGTAIALPEDAELPAVSAATVLSGVSIREEGRRRSPLIIGVTAPSFAQWVRFGQPAGLAPFPVAVASAITSGRTAGAAFSLSAPLQALVVLLWFLVGSVVCRRFRAAPAKIFLPAVASLLISTGAYAVLLVVTPVTGAVLAALVAPTVTLLSERRRTREFADRVTRLHRGGGGIRFAPAAALIHSEKELIRKLGWFSRSVLSCPGCVYYRLNNSEQCYEHAGGYEIEPAELAVLRAACTDEPFATAARNRPTGVLCKGVFKDDRGSRVVPITTGPDVVGMWVVPHQPETPAPEATKAAAAAQYLADRLSIDANTARHRPTADSALVDQLERVHQLVHEGIEERKQLEAVLEELPVPLVIADMSGVVLFVNRALSTLLVGNDLGVIATMRDLLFRLADEQTATRLAASLFSAREQASFVWSTSAGRNYRIELQPFYRSWNAPGEDLVGFIATFLDISVTFELRTMRKNVSDFLSEQIRARLMRITAQLAIAQTIAEDEAVRANLDSVEEEVNGVTDILNKATTFLFEPETQLFEAVPSNPNDVVNMAVTYVKRNANGNAVAFDVRLPEVPMPVDIHTAQAIEHLTRILQQVHRTTAAGETIALDLHEDIDRSILRIAWPSFQIHAGFVEQANTAGPEEAGHGLPPLLVACVQAKEVFPQLHVDKETNTRMTIAIDLQRP